MVIKQHLAIGIYKIVRQTVKLSAKIVAFFSEKLNFRSQHSDCVRSLNSSQKMC